LQIVVDTNIVFSSILNPTNNIGNILFFSTELFTFLSPELLRTEILNHKSKILNISKYSELQFLDLLGFVAKNITFVNQTLLSQEAIQIAEDLVHDIDINDQIFVAFTIEADALLWTGDKKLYNGLKSKSFDKLINTEEILRIYREKAV
jgi:predicted nucleic acid-binding protein